MSLKCWYIEISEDLAMKKLGLLGGMSCESTVLYYKIINEYVRAELGGTTSARIGMESFNFQEIEKMQFENRWNELGQKLSDAAVNLEKGGADYVMICTNLMHKVAPAVQEAVNIPLLHIVDSIAEQILAQGMNKVGLLGTIFTMEEDFYSKKLLDDYGIETIIPESDDRYDVSNIIYKELCQGKITCQAKDKYLKVIDKMKEDGAQGVILGCTEIPLLLKQAALPLFDTAEIHALYAARKVLS